LAKTSADVCASGWIDPEVKTKVEKQLKNRKDWTLVDAVETADLVFLVESLYINPERDRDYRKRWRSVSMAIVDPSDVCRQDPANSESLLAARLWEGVTLRGGVRPPDFQSASPEELVTQFLKKNWPIDLPPLCGARSMPQATGPEADRDKPTLKATESSKPVPLFQKPPEDNAIRVRLR
jgi:hypothetical protein